MKTEPGVLFPVSGELTLDEIMSRVRTELRHRRQEVAAATMGDGDLADDGESFMRWEPPSARLELKQAYTLPELLQFSDADFIDTAYRVLLRRAADVEGRKHYLTALRHGSVSKVTILGEIRFSPEGMRRAIHVDGLLLPYKLRKLRRIPVLGRCVAFVLAILRLPRLATSIQALENTSGRETQRLGTLLNKVELANEERFIRLQEVSDGLATRAEVQAVSAELQAVSVGLQAVGAELQAVSAEFASKLAEAEKLSDHIAEMQVVDRSIASLRKQLTISANRQAELQSTVSENKRSVLDIQRRLMAFLDSVQAQSAEPVTQSKIDAGLGDILSAQYVSFEDTFRGSREDIKQRAAHYLGTLASKGLEGTSGLVLDLGCGRGEWLEVLVEHGYRGRGVDMNRVMVDEAVARGFDAVEADAIAYLRDLPDGSVAAITSMHLVEHLPYETLIRFLDEAMRVLSPRGLLILETPNPENLTVGACWFYMDPTHRNPIPPALLQWLVGDRGFTQAEIERLSVNRGVPALKPLSQDVPGAAEINQLISLVTAPPDYAVIALKP